LGGFVYIGDVLGCISGSWYAWPVHLVMVSVGRGRHQCWTGAGVVISSGLVHIVEDIPGCVV
jgi:hypothetical protein